MIYTKDMKLGYQHLDFSGHWRMADMFSELADLATEHAQSLNVWNPSMAGSYGWVVSKYHFRILKPLTQQDEIHISTWPSTGTRVVFPRYYQVKNGHDEICIEGVGLWTLLDLKNRRITMPSRVGITFPEQLAAPLDISVEASFSDDEGYTFMEERQVRYSDIDVNQHLNNARYIEWTCDLIDCHRFKEGYIADLSIYFKKETAPGQILTLEMKEVDDQFFVRGMRDGQMHFMVEGQWKKY